MDENDGVKVIMTNIGKNCRRLGAALLLAGLLGGCGQTAQLELPPNADIDAAAATSAVLAALPEQMAERHDRYAIYYSAEEYEELFRSVTGTYSGIGVYIYPDDATGCAMIYGVFKDGPAYKAGILPGDIFVSLNGEDLTALDYDAVADKLIGFAAGTKLNLLMRRTVDGEITEVPVTVTTAKVDIPTVDALMLDDGLGLIKIASFNQNTGEQFIEAYEQLLSEGMQGLVLDLRNNGGGELNAALTICNMFVPKGEPMMYICGTDGEYYYTSNREAIDTPTVILQNGHTASASEVVIGAAHDCGKATLIGENTYGKGIVQDLRQLKSGAGLRFTSAKYSTAHHNDIHGVGIAPDIEYPMPDDADALAAYSMDVEADPQLAKACEVLQEKLAANN